MANFPIVRIQRSLPGTSGGVQSNVDVGAIGRAVEGLGRTISSETSKALSENRARKAEMSIMEAEIRKRQQAMIDSNAKMDLRAFKNQHKNEQTAFREQNPDPTGWEKASELSIAKLRERLAKVNASEETKQGIIKDFEVWAEDQRGVTLSDSISALESKTTGRLTQALIEEVATGDPDTKQEAFNSYVNHLMDSVGKSPEEAIAMAKEIVDKGIENKEKVIKQGLLDGAVQEPGITIETINNELEARKQGQGDIELVSNTDLQAVITYAMGVQSQRVNESKAAAQQREFDGQKAIVSVDGDLSLLPAVIATIQNDPAISPQDKTDAIKSLTSWSQSYASAVKAAPIETDRATYAKHIRAVSSIALDPTKTADLLLAINEDSDQLNDTDFKALTKSVYSQTDRTIAGWTTDAYRQAEKMIKDTSPLGILQTDEQSEIAFTNATLKINDAIAKLKEEGRLTQENIAIETVIIAREELNRLDVEESLEINVERP